MLSFADQFSQRGYLLVERVFDRAFIAELHSEFIRQFEQCTNDDATVIDVDHIKVGERRVMITPQLTGPFLDARLYANPIIHRIVASLLGNDFVIDSLMCVTALSGAKLQHRHRDHPGLFPEMGAADRSVVPPYAVSVAIPLVDLDDSSGATTLYPRSQVLDNVEDDHESIMTYGRTGGCYMMDFRLIHRGTPNRSANQRPIIYITYVRPWFTDNVNFKKQAKIIIDPADLSAIGQEQRCLFSRLAAKGAMDRSEVELF